jgi:hypothetical protein
MHTELPILILYFSSFCIWNLTFGRALAGYISRERIWILISLSISHSLIIFIQKSYEDWHPKHWTRSETERCISCMSHYLRTGLLVFGMWCYVERTRTLIPWRRWGRSMFLCNMWNRSQHNIVWHPGRLKSLIKMFWKPQNSKIHYLLYTTWQSKSLHYKTFHNTTGLTFHINKISLHCNIPQ